MPAADLLIPTLADLAGWGGTGAAALAMIGLGRLASGGAARPEAALVAGWGLLCLVLTLWGVALPLPLDGPAAALGLAGLAALVLPRFRLRRGDWAALGRIALLAVPLVAVMASARPAEPDTFLNLLPNAAYLHDYGVFPGPGRPDAHSYLPTAPYNLQLAVFLAGLAARAFPLDGMIAFNIVLQLAAALLLARLVEARTASAAPSWGAAALGLLGATLLDPGFVPRYDLAGYSEPGVAVALAFAAWSALGTIAAAESRRGRAAPILFAASLAALVNMKQDSVALALALVAAAVAVAVSSPSRGRAAASVVAAAVPAALLYGAWRWYVLTHMPQGELQLLPPAHWQFGALGLILLNMLRIAAGKGVFYAALAAAIAAGLWRWRRVPADPGGRMGALLCFAFVLYSAALVFAYATLFPGTMGSDAHSYFRYCTHLSLLLMATAALLLGPRLAAHLSRPAVALCLAALLVASPLAAVKLLRFDLDPPDLRVWLLAAEAAPALSDHERVALLLPGDNGSVAAMLGTILRTAPPRRPDLDLVPVTALPPGLIERLAAEGFDGAILSCAPPGFGPVPQGSAAILLHGNALDWRAVDIFHYPPAAAGRWSHVLAYQPLCL